MLVRICPDFLSSFVDQNYNLNQFKKSSSWLKNNGIGNRNYAGAAVLSIYYKPGINDKNLSKVEIWLERFMIKDFTTASVFFYEQKYRINVRSLVASPCVQNHSNALTNSDIKPKTEQHVIQLNDSNINSNDVENSGVMNKISEEFEERLSDNYIFQVKITTKD